jgi:hypothetical protein
VRTLAIIAVIIAVALLVLGLVLEALGWLLVIGLAALVVAAVAGWLAVREIRAGDPQPPSS